MTKLEVKHQCVFFSREPTVPTVKGIMVHFYDKYPATKYCIKHVENCKKKKKCLNVAPLLLKSQESAQECWNCEIVLQIRRSADKVPSAIGTCLEGGGEFSSPQNLFFSLTFPRINFFRPVHEYFLGLLGVHLFFL